MFISKDLANFIVVAKNKSINKATKELFITESPISRSLKKLEFSLGVKLFVRKSQGLTLTEEGECLYNKVISLYEQLKDIEEDYKNEKRSDSNFYKKQNNELIDFEFLR
ncbi:helix-turn-helix domain-containing protein [Xenorhabdus szentirmaii]|uniref:LysR-family transcriptional regulatory protein n=2 Tax=Xenorhabdus szentirmaii TaxID=290112 RepID=W1J3P5_9GAMM|nr:MULTISPECIES: LysR family transcriptional regulator [Xenorhabdus]MBD2781713.1 LysR family transcriptional regulator [Xenorhabdus sp. 38]MBD2793317.1 LysR family transcriptional regulator [Xenorhabdus sp. CUL]MBD2801890.1 LysR family transcriptional regulator [Xenorhabdus sp. M]MBD2805160.1 LysR family transcriptional regulator [Xenorhabdus sp. ZM]MBD2820100.1 LysR family transcriptional regulator [Xenorhabdus sp. 42]